MATPGEYRNGWIDPDLLEEFPDLRLVHLELPAQNGRTPPELKQRLRDLSDGIGGPQAVALRQQPVPWSYRVFFRHIGLDPDRDRTPIEAAVLDRIRAGQFVSRSLLADATLAALVETGVPVWAMDAATVAGDGMLGIRAAEPGETIGRYEDPLPATDGRIAVVDELGPVADLFGPIPKGHAVDKHTRRMVLFSVQVRGVPTIHVEEALDQVCEWLGA